MQVIATPEARAFIAARGGVAFVRPLQRKCCGGALTVLAATTTAPRDATEYEAVGDPDLGVRYRRAGSSAVLASSPIGAPAADAGAEAGISRREDIRERATLVLPRAEPAELLIELRGRLRPHLVACWDGCLFKI